MSEFETDDCAFASGWCMECSFLQPLLYIWLDGSVLRLCIMLALIKDVNMNVSKMTLMIKPCWCETVRVFEKWDWRPMMFRQVYVGGHTGNLLSTFGHLGDLDCVLLD